MQTKSIMGVKRLSAAPACNHSQTIHQYLVERDRAGVKKTYDESVGSDLESLLNVPGTLGNDSELLEPPDCLSS